MFINVVVALCVLGVDTNAPKQMPAPTRLRVTLTPNAYRIQECDVLLLRTTLENPDPGEDLLVELDGDFLGCHMRLQMKKGEEWLPLSCIDEDLLRNALFGDARLEVRPQSIYAEYHWLHDYHGRYVFNREGLYVLRATAKTSRGDLRSNEIKVQVIRRDDDDLDFVVNDRVFKSFHSPLFLHELPETPPNRPGGNIERIFSAQRLAREYFVEGTIKGQKTSIEDMPKSLLTEMDQITWEYFMIRFGYHYEGWLDMESLSHIVAALPCDSAAARSFRANLERARKHPKKNPEAPTKTE